MYVYIYYFNYIGSLFAGRDNYVHLFIKNSVEYILFVPHNDSANSTHS